MSMHFAGIAPAPVLPLVSHVKYMPYRQTIGLSVLTTVTSAYRSSGWGNRQVDLMLVGARNAAGQAESTRSHGNIAAPLSPTTLLRYCRC